MPKKLFLPYLSIIFANLTIGLSYFFTIISLRHATPFEGLAYRFFFAFCFVIILRILKIINFSIALKDIVQILPIAILYPCMFFAFQAFGLENISSVEASVIMSLTPIFTLVFSEIFLNEKTTISQKLLILISVITIVCVLILDFLKSDGNFKFSPLGITLILISALSNSAYVVLLKSYGSKFEPTKIVFLISIVGVVVFLPLGILFTKNISSFFHLILNLEFVFSNLFLSIFTNFMTIILFAYSLRYIQAFKIGIFANLSTIVALFVGVLFLDENLRFYYIIATIIIIFCVTKLNLTKEKNETLHCS